MSRLSVPLEILSDRASKFLGILHSKTAPYRPQSNGAVERFHHTLMQMVRKSVADHRDWDEHLQYLLLLAVKLPALLQASCHLSYFSGVKYMDPSTSYDSNGFQPRQPLPQSWNGWLNSAQTSLRWGLSQSTIRRTLKPEPRLDLIDQLMLHLSTRGTSTRLYSCLLRPP